MSNQDYLNNNNSKIPSYSCTGFYGKTHSDEFLYHAENIRQVYKYLEELKLKKKYNHEIKYECKNK